MAKLAAVEASHRLRRQKDTIVNTRKVDINVTGESDVGFD